MHLNCPNCQAAIEVIHEESVAFLTCSSCGSRIRPSSEVTETLQPKVRQKIDEYELVEYLGGGTFGDVWKAYDPGLKTHVAIKVPRERNFAHPAKELFLREARIMATLSHPHIVRV
ncbi:MAG: protein kinase, partial [Pirellulales bacterium]